MARAANALGTIGKIVGYGIAIALVVGALVTGIWILLAGALMVILGMFAAGTTGRGTGE